MVKNSQPKNYVGISGIPKEAETLTGISVGDIVTIRGDKFIVSVDVLRGEKEVIFVTKNRTSYEHIKETFGEFWDKIWVMPPYSKELARIKSSTSDCRAALRKLKKEGYDPAKLTLKEAANFYYDYQMDPKDMEYAVSQVPTKARIEK